MQIFIYISRCTIIELQLYLFQISLFDFSLPLSAGLFISLFVSFISCLNPFFDFFEKCFSRVPLVNLLKQVMIQKDFSLLY